jgi:transposase-like protein
MPTTIAHRSPFNVPRWTEAQAREVIAALERSGKTVSVFAAEHGLDPQRVWSRWPDARQRGRGVRCADESLSRVTPIGWMSGLER